MVDAEHRLLLTEVPDHCTSASDQMGRCSRQKGAFVDLGERIFCSIEKTGAMWVFSRDLFGDSAQNLGGENKVLRNLDPLIDQPLYHRHGLSLVGFLMAWQLHRNTWPALLSST